MIASVFVRHNCEDVKDSHSTREWVGPGMNTYSFCHTQFKIQILIEVEYLTERLFRGLTLTLKPDGTKV